jgi:hypothetical protein
MGILAPIPGLIGAVVSVGLVRSGFLGFLFLLPLGIMAYCYNGKTAWFSAVVVILGNGVFSLVMGPLGLHNPGALLMDSLYLTALIAAFTWLMAPPDKGPSFLRLPAVYRLISGSVAVSLVFGLVLYSTRKDGGFYSLFREQAEAIASLYTAASGADVVQRSLLEQYMTADHILATLGAIALRGGMVVSSVLLFFISRQLSLVIFWFVRRRRVGGSITGFHVKPRCIWELSGSLLVILAGLRLQIAPLEIAGWNMAVICMMLYLAQGGGIMLFFLSRSTIPPMMRFLLNMVIVLVILSPGINVAALGALAILGIAENWVPFRTPKTNGSSSTPGMME